MVKREVLEQLMDSKKTQVLKVLANSKEELCLKEITEKCNVPLTSVFRILQELGSVGLVKRKEWKNSKVYSLEDNEKTAFIKELFTEEFDGLDEFVSLAGNLPGVQNLILSGPKKGDKASVLVIGEGVDTNKIREICQQLKIKGFEVTFLTLGREQYEQMTRMGLYPGEKKVLK